jgi:hypothetical protein
MYFAGEYSIVYRFAVRLLRTPLIARKDGCATAIYFLIVHRPFVPEERDTMENMVFASGSVLEMTEKWAKSRQVSGHPHFSQAPADPEDLEDCQFWFFASWVCQLLVATAVLSALVNF